MVEASRRSGESQASLPCTFPAPTVPPRGHPRPLPHQEDTALSTHPYRHAFGIAMAVIAAVALSLLAWQLVFVLLVAFGGVLLAVLFHHCAAALTRHTPLSDGLAVAVTILGIVAALLVFMLFAGPRIAAQLATLAQSLPEALKDVEDALRQTGWGTYLLDNTPDRVSRESEWSLLSGLGGTVSTLVAVVANFVVALVVAIFLTIDPGLYRQGFAKLLPPPGRPRALEVMDRIGQDLWRWELGQAIDMAAVALAIGLGLWAIGVPLPLTLGLIAGLTNFVPYVGPILGSVPAVLIASTQGIDAAVWTVVLFIVVQQLEGHVLMPMIQKRATALPPVLTVLVVVGASVPFGLLGVLLATPMLVVVMVLVRTLWIEDALGDR